jgi:hypothetical protein
MEYHKIETLFWRDDATHKVKPGVLKNPVYGIIKSWQWTEKIDGTNIRCIWKEGKLSFGGKTDNASIPADLVKTLYETISADKFKEIFPDVDAVVYGEGYGAGIQKGGLYSPVKKLIVFDVLVGGKWWVNFENTMDIAMKLGLETVPFIGDMTLEEGVAMVREGFQSRIGEGQARAEGLVGRTVETLFDKKGSRLIVKLKSKDF